MILAYVYGQASVRYHGRFNKIATKWKLFKTAVYRKKECQLTLPNSTRWLTYFWSYWRHWRHPQWTVWDRHSVAWPGPLSVPSGEASLGSRWPPCTWCLHPAGAALRPAAERTPATNPSHWPLEDWCLTESITLTARGLMSDWAHHTDR